MYLKKSALLKDNLILNILKIQDDGPDIDTGQSSTQKEEIIMFTMRYQLVTDWYLRTKRGNRNMVFGDFTMQDGRTQTHITIEELPPETYHQSKCKVSCIRACSQHYY